MSSALCRSCQQSTFSHRIPTAEGRALDRDPFVDLIQNPSESRAQEPSVGRRDSGLTKPDSRDMIIQTRGSGDIGRNARIRARYLRAGFPVVFLSAAKNPVSLSRITEYAPVMELADMRDLGSRVERRVGSSPFRRTRKSSRGAAFSVIFAFGE